MTDDKQYNLAAAMRFIGRAIGFTAALFMMVMLIGGAFAETGPVKTAGILLAIIGAAALAGCILSFWRERLAIVLLLLVAIGLGIHIGVYAGRNHFVTWLVLGLPYLAAAALLFCGWWLERKGLNKWK
jgi:hypothetical protein